MNIITTASISAFLSLPVIGEAATIIVDGSKCTLQSAITSANTDTLVEGCPAGSGADTLVLTQDITLSSIDNEAEGFNGLPPITSPITLNGQSHIIARSSDHTTPAFRLVYISESGKLEIRDTVLTHGFVAKNNTTPTQEGGAIFNRGELVLLGSWVSHSFAEYRGCGVMNYGKLTLNNTKVTDNGCLGQGAAVENEVQTMRITNSVVSDNSAYGIGNNGVASIVETTIENNFDLNIGGILNEGELALIRSTVSGNFSSVVGGIWNRGDMRVKNSTISENKSHFNGAAIYNQGDIEVVNSTIKGKGTLDYDLGSVQNESSMRIENSIIAKVEPGFRACVNTGSISTAGINLIEDGSCGASSFPAGTDPRLSSLAYYGGPTRTCALLPQSPAINATDCTMPIDQRSVARPQPPAGKCDIGAFEKTATDNILTVFDKEVAKGKLRGTGKGKVQKQRVKQYRSILLTAVQHIYRNRVAQACSALKEGLRRLDRNGKISPRELVSGKAAKKLAKIIKVHRAKHGCK